MEIIASEQHVVKHVLSQGRVIIMEALQDTRTLLKISTVATAVYAVELAALPDFLGRQSGFQENQLATSSTVMRLWGFSVQTPLAVLSWFLANGGMSSCLTSSLFLIYFQLLPLIGYLLLVIFLLFGGLVLQLLTMSLLQEKPISCMVTALSWLLRVFSSLTQLVVHKETARNADSSYLKQLTSFLNK